MTSRSHRATHINSTGDDNNTVKLALRRWIDRRGSEPLLAIMRDD
jgi:hypothetical protein